MSDDESRVSLSLGDLQTVLSILDVCSQRGAFKGNELEDIGKLYNHLELFIKQNKKSDPDPEPENDNESESSDNNDDLEEQKQVNNGDNKNV